MSAPRLVALGLLLAPLAFKDAPWLPAGVAIAVEQIDDEQGATCLFRVVNRSQQFLTEWSIRSALEGAGPKARPRVLSRQQTVAPAGWLRALTPRPTSFTSWRGARPEVALAPGESQQFGVTFAPPREGPQVICSQLPLAAVLTQRLPWPQPPAEFTVTLLRLAMAAVHGGTEQVFQAEVELRNVSGADALINAGQLAARVADPSALDLVELGEDGSRTRLLNLEVAGVAGRVDPMSVPMSGGSSFTVVLRRLALEPLEPGRHAFVVEFDGRSDLLVNSGAPVLHFWSGHVESKPVWIDVR